MDVDERLGGEARTAYGGGRFATLRWIAETASTNTDLAAAARRGEGEQVLVAELQTAGRGRLGRSWEAPSSSSLLMSVLVRPRVDVDRLSLVSPALALSVVDAARELGAENVTLSWPNDVIVPVDDGVLGYRKLAGVLAEAVGDGGDITAVVAGSGVNVELPPGFATDRNVPVDLTSLVGGPVDRPRLAAAILRHLSARIERLEADGGQALVDEMQTGCWTVGRDVVVSGGSAELVGVATAIDPVGRLVVRTGSGDHVLDAGDVSVR